MEDLQTETLSDYENKKQTAENLDLNKNTENECAANLLNGSEDIDDPLDLIDNCENASIGSNSDVWKGSDSEDESFDKEASKNPEIAGKETIEKEQINETAEAPSNSTNQETSEAKQPTDKTEDKVMEDLFCPEKLSEENTASQSQTEKTKQNDKDDVQMSETAQDKDDVQMSETGQDKDDAQLPETVQDKDVVQVSETVQDKDDVPLPETVEDKDVAEIISDKDPLAIDVEEALDALKAKNSMQDDDSQNGFNDDDDDFDPSLLCPEVSMAVDENPVITNSGNMPNDGNLSPLPYEAVFSTYVDEVTGAEISFNLTAEEQELRRRLYGPTNPVQFSKIHCTACNVHLGSALEGQNNRFVHPLLKVMICKECYHFYTSGEFEKDEDGSELYCRWCGQGGQVLCCSKCEFVFCKRCIRTNFGRKKMFEIRDSDNWECFRCNPSQLITQRIACYEFFEYVKREQSLAATSIDTDFWSRDYSRCCSAKKRALEDGEESKKVKRKRGNVDPDYNPAMDQKPPLTSIPNSVFASPSSSGNNMITFPTGKGISFLPKPVQLIPRFNKNKDNDIEFVRAIPAPQVALTTINKKTVNKTANIRNYRTILPNIKIRPVPPPPTLVRINSNPPPPLVPANSRLVANPMFVRPANPSNMMKHEWFEKTVRAAARVNSHLSYTLTQLNKAQSQAASVEELAVVHNKLQEIMSSSINSLIQIRKNLRTEFIAGIKTVRLPSKKAESFANDDDVIFVSAPSTSQAKAPDPIIIIDKSVKGDSTSTKSPETEKPKSYLKVKSVMELQNVPSECITIPDDPSEEKSKEDEVEEEKKNEESKITDADPLLCNGVTEDKNEEVKKPEEVKKSEEVKKPEKVKVSQSQSTEDPAYSIKEKPSPEIKCYNMKEKPSPEIKKMLSVTVKLPKVDLEDLQKRLPNGCH